MKSKNIVIIGAGIAGLACARHLADAGLNPVVFDKGRGIGGRVATRRAGDLRFDHGAPYAGIYDAATRGDFDARLHDLIATGHAAPWVDGSGRTWLVGTPGMSSIPKGLATGLDVRLGTHITSVEHNGSGWQIADGETRHTASHVVITVPQPQIAGLLGNAHPLVAQTAGVEMSRGLTLMVATQGDVAVPSMDAKDDIFASITADSTKPQRPRNDATAWVAQATLDYSLTHLGLERPDIAARMLPAFCDRLGISTDRVTHAVAHRWRYSRVAKPLGQPFMRTSDATLYLGGDWCVGRHVQDAWTSGTAIARDLLGS